MSNKEKIEKIIHPFRKIEEHAQQNIKTISNVQKAKEAAKATNKQQK